MSDAGRKLRLEVIWKTIDQMTAPTRKVMATNKEMARGLKETRDKLKELEKAQKQVGEFRELHSGLRGTSTALREAEERVRKLAQGIAAVDAPTRKMTREFNSAVAAARELKNQHQQQTHQLQQLRDRFTAAGESTRNLGSHERSLRSDIAATNASMAAQREKLAQLQRQEERMGVARDKRDKLRSSAGALAGAGVGATAAGAVMGIPVKGGLHEATHMQTEMQRINALGLGPKESQEAIKFAQGMKTYGTSQNENVELMRDAMTVFADSHHAEMVTPLLAKMKFANKAMYGAEKGEENDKKFMDMLKVIEMRGGLASEAEFKKQANMVQKVLTATGGRVGPEEWLNVIKTGGLAAKNIDSDAFYNQLEPLVQEMGGNRVGTAMMSAYQNLYQGRTTKRVAQNLDSLGLIGDPTKVQHDKAGQVSYLNPGAIKGSELFKTNQFEWMEKVLLPALAAKGITEKQQVLDAIGGIFSNRTASNLFSQMYLQRDQIHKNEKLNRGAADIDTLDTLAKDTAAGKMAENTAKLRDLQLELGQQVLPMFVSALESVTGAIKSATEFMREHTTTAKVLMVAIAALAGALLIIGPAMLAVASVLGPLAVVRFMFQAAGIQGGVFANVLRLVGGAFRFVGTAVMWVGRALLTNPIVALIAALAVVAYLIYDNWGAIKTFFADLWAGVVGLFNTAVSAIGGALSRLWSQLQAAFANVVSWLGGDLPSKFMEFGRNLIGGLVNGITSAMGAVKDAVMNVGSSAVSWFKDKLGIHSPSRVFAELGGFTMSGLEQGITNQQAGPLSAVHSLAKQMTAVGAGIAITASAPVLANSSFDTRPPLAAQARQQAAPAGGDTIVIHVHAAPGMDTQQLAQMVRAEMERAQRANAARSRSRFTDSE
ncbi:phage tail protein [Pandoraea cepalis]|uniref:Phage tail protein n=1 Tax=Pandoraea cepalis TaxID=2508294 RepID=A0AAW7MJF6_9BURK|nr:phage tail protein [Pandoraea cepalis]MDN4572898.1 phage tail protein [Pandoraea cepalis]MDN4577261.1 phage tail protein [Pandoraea cepalis]